MSHQNIPQPPFAIRYLRHYRSRCHESRTVHRQRLCHRVEIAIQIAEVKIEQP